jgi:DsbC/DsbD-like thiol-disulfide interchange protein
MRRLVFALALVLTARAAGAGAVYMQPVSATLVADAARVVPGQPFTVGVLLTIQRGWHVYWQNPGDSGLPTSVKLVLPEGVTAGALRWPLPTRFEQPGNLVGYGYADRVLLAAPLTATAPTDAPLRADVGWLACEQLCIRGKASVDLAQPATPQPALFAEWAARTPLPAGAPDAPRVVGTSGAIPTDGSEGTLTVALEWREAPAAAELFPGFDPAIDFSQATVHTDGRRGEITLRGRTLAGQTRAGAQLESLVTYADAAGARHGAQVALPLDGKEH